MITLVSVLREGEAGLGLNINISFFGKHIDTLFKQKIKLYCVVYVINYFHLLYGTPYVTEYSTTLFFNSYIGLYMDVP